MKKKKDDIIRTPDCNDKQTLYQTIINLSFRLRRNLTLTLDLKPFSNDINLRYIITEIVVTIGRHEEKKQGPCVGRR